MSGRSKLRGQRTRTRRPRQGRWPARLWPRFSAEDLREARELLDEIGTRLPKRRLVPYVAWLLGVARAVLRSPVPRASVGPRLRKWPGRSPTDRYLDVLASLYQAVGADFPELGPWRLRILYEALAGHFPGRRLYYDTAKRKVHELLRRIARTWARRGLRFTDPRMTAMFQDRRVKLYVDYPLTVGTWLACRERAAASPPVAPRTA